MRAYHALLAAVAIAFCASPALAAPDLAGTTWVDDECMDAFKFYEGAYDESGAFHEIDIAGDYFGSWRLDGDTLILEYEDGDVMQTVISSDVFVLNFTTRGDDYACEFRLE